MSGSTTFTPIDAAAIVVVAASVLGYVNLRFLRLPRSVGLTAMGAVTSLMAIGVNRWLFRDPIGPEVVGFINGLALSLPDGPARYASLTATYVMVLFSVIIQGGTIGWVLRRLAPVIDSRGSKSDREDSDSEMFV